MDFQCGRRRQGQLPARCGEVRCSLFCWYLNALKVLVGRAMQSERKSDPDRFKGDLLCKGLSWDLEVGSVRWEADCASALLRFRTVRTSEALDALVGLLPNPGHTWKHSDLLSETCWNRTCHTCFVKKILPVQHPRSYCVANP